MCTGRYRTAQRRVVGSGCVAPADLDAAFSQLVAHTLRDMALDEGMRADGRGLLDLRPVFCEVSTAACGYLFVPRRACCAEYSLPFCRMNPARRSACQIEMSTCCVLAYKTPVKLHGMPERVLAAGRLTGYRSYTGRRCSSWAARRAWPLRRSDRRMTNSACRACWTPTAGASSCTSPSLRTHPQMCAATRCILGEGLGGEAEQGSQILVLLLEFAVVRTTTSSAMDADSPCLWQSREMTPSFGSRAGTQHKGNVRRACSGLFTARANTVMIALQVGRGAGSGGRREAGTSDFVRRALLPVMPDRDDFGFTVRLNADALAVDGSAAAASVCSGALALADAGVPASGLVAAVTVGSMEQPGSDGARGRVPHGFPPRPVECADSSSGAGHGH